MRKALLLLVMTGCYTQNLTVENTLDASLIATMSTAAKPPQEFEVPRLKPSLKNDEPMQASGFAPAKETAVPEHEDTRPSALQPNPTALVAQPVSGTAIEKAPAQNGAEADAEKELPLSVSQVPAESFDRGFSVQDLESKPAPQIPEGVKPGAEDTMGGDDELWHLKQGVLD